MYTFVSARAAGWEGFVTFASYIFRKCRKVGLSGTASRALFPAGEIHKTLVIGFPLRRVRPHDSCIKCPTRQSQNNGLGHEMLENLVQVRDPSHRNKEELTSLIVRFLGSIFTGFISFLLDR